MYNLKGRSSSLAQHVIQAELQLFLKKIFEVRLLFCFKSNRKLVDFVQKNNYDNK